jgi:hypothetical protein
MAKLSTFNELFLVPSTASARRSTACLRVAGDGGLVVLAG